MMVTFLLACGLSVVLAADDKADRKEALRIAKAHEATLKRMFKTCGECDGRSRARPRATQCRICDGRLKVVRDRDEFGAWFFRLIQSRDGLLKTVSKNRTALKRFRDVERRAGEHFKYVASGNSANHNARQVVLSKVDPVGKPIYFHGTVLEVDEQSATALFEFGDDPKQRWVTVPARNAQNGLTQRLRTVGTYWREHCIVKIPDGVRWVRNSEVFVAGFVVGKGEYFNGGVAHETVLVETVPYKP